MPTHTRDPPQAARQLRLGSSVLDGGRFADDDAAAAVARLLETVRAAFVTGKGGAGKTTVATLLGMAAAGRGRRAVVCEVAATGQVARAFGRGTRAGAETELSERLSCLSLDPQEALREWLRRQPGGRVVEAVLSRSRAFAHFVAAAPGAKELVLIGKALDLVGLTPDGCRHARFDLAIVDAPSTGHALGMLAAPAALARATPIGPIGDQARALADVLADPKTVGYVGVALPEEMSVHELLELEHGLIDGVGRGLDLIVVNGVYPDRFTDAEAERLAALAETSAAAGMLESALSMHRVARAHAARVAALRAHASAPVIVLPYRFTAALGPPEYAALARDLDRASAVTVHALR